MLFEFCRERALKVRGWLNFCTPESVTPATCACQGRAPRNPAPLQACFPGQPKHTRIAPCHPASAPLDPTAHAHLRAPAHAVPRLLHPLDQTLQLGAALQRAQACRARGRSRSRRAQA